MAKESAKSYAEAELVKTFRLQNIMASESERMITWLSVEAPTAFQKPLIVPKARN